MVHSAKAAQTTSSLNNCGLKQQCNWNNWFVIYREEVATFSALEGMDNDVRWHWQQIRAPCRIEVQSGGLSSFTVNEWCCCMLLFGRIKLQTGQKKGTKIGLWEVGDTSIHRVDYWGYDKVHGWCVPYVPHGGYALGYLEKLLKQKNSAC